MKNAQEPEELFASTDSDSDSESDTEQEVADDIIIQRTEKFNQHRLLYILQNKAKFKKQMRKSCFENDHNPFSVIEKYLKKSVNGQISVSYKQNNGVGRFFAIGGLSMQSLPREIRHSIAPSNYNDVDMVNAHPVILAFLCRQRKILCPYLDKYIANRDKLLSDLKVDPETGKVAVLSFMNGGLKAYDALEHKPRWITKMKKEIDIIHRTFSLDRVFEAHKQKREAEGLSFNHRGSYINTLLCDFENTILQEMWQYMNSPSECVLCFDGIMYPTEHTIIINDISEHIKKTVGITIELKIKQMNQGFVMPENIPIHTDHVWYYHHLKDFCKQGPNMNMDDLLDWMKDTHIVALQRGRSMLFTKNLELDGSVSYEPQEKMAMADFRWKMQSEGKSYPMSMNKIFADKIMYSNAYDYFNFIPYLTMEQKRKISPRLFNTFSGYRWDYNDKKGLLVPPDSIKPWIDHVMNTLCKNGQSDINLGHRVMQWYAHIFQNPTIKPWAIVFMSEEGLGKGLWQTFFEQVLTKSLATVFTSWDQITGSFNGKMAGKLLFTLNEATNYPTNTQKELMKTIIKDTELSVNKKFVNQYDVDNYARVQITTNNKRPVSIDYDDRRYCCIESDNSVRGNKEYFAPLVASLNDEQTQHDMFDFLTNYPLEGFDSEKPPLTNWKKELINQNLSPVIVFIKDLLSTEKPDILADSDEESESDDDEKIDEGMNFKPKELYDKYVEWSSKNGEHKAGSARAFKSELLKHNITLKSVRVNGKPVKGFQLVKSEIQPLMAKLLCMPEFEF